VSNYENLSDHDFEFLIADLFRAEFGGRYEVFPRGADGGIDVRRILTDRGPIVVQCKHMLRSGFSKLKTSARHEVVKLEAMDPKPSEYFFVTTQSLSDKRKGELVVLLDPWVTSRDHILGSEDVDRLVANHPQIERSHVKLYLSSGGHLDRVVHAATFEQSAQLRSEIKLALPKYVETGAFSQARLRLVEQKAIVISGPPGIGKTTLAQLLVADAMSEGYEPIQISRDIAEGWDIINDHEKRVFYYDDFLGATFLESRLDKNEDRRISSFLQRCAASSNNLFILTTREHLFSQALEWYESIRGGDLETNKLILQLKDYSTYEKAKILYNHLYAVDRKLLAKVRSNLASWDKVQAIIEHENYTPRSIAAIVSGLPKSSTNDFAKHAIKVLDTPSLIWEHAFSREIDSSGQDLVIALCMNPFQDPKELQQRFQGLAAARGNPSSKRAFQDALARVEGSFLKAVNHGGLSRIVVMNPSVTDFVTEWLRKDEEMTHALLNSCNTFREVEFLLEEVLLDSDFKDNPVLVSAFGKAAVRTVVIKSDRLGIIPNPGQLLFLLEAEVSLPRAAKKLRKHLEKGLDAAVHRWPLASATQAGEMVRLASKMDKANRLSEDLLLAIEACLVNNSDKYSWPHTVELVERFSPRLTYDLEHLSDAFRAWAEQEAEWDGFADEDEIAEAQRLGTHFGVDEYDDVWDIASMSLEQRRSHEPADTYEGSPRSAVPGEPEDDSTLIMAMLGRLGEHR
jgi:DNA polymerase III delta prime subunit